jgi:cation-transporting ATPase E
MTEPAIKKNFIRSDKNKREQLFNEVIKNAERFSPPFNEGLTAAQIKSRIENGLTNKTKNKKSKSILKILSDNILTFFNLIWAIITAALIFVGAYAELFFLVIIVSNTVIGIFQEIRSKITLDKLSLISAPAVTTIREGQKVVVSADELLLDDVMFLENGKQICADGTVAEGAIEVNEALLTGESAAVTKKTGDMLYAGSFVSSGSCYARVQKIGKANYIQSLIDYAKQFKKNKGQLIKSLSRIINVIGVLLLFVAPAMLYTNYHQQGGDIYKTVTSTAASIIGMIPSGMYLLTTIALATSVIKLSANKVLVQELYGIEMLARTNVLCLDKTGTITDGTMRVVEVLSLDGGTDKSDKADKTVGGGEGGKATAAKAKATKAVKAVVKTAAARVDSVARSVSRSVRSAAAKGEAPAKHTVDEIMSSFLAAVKDSNMTSLAMNNYFGTAQKLLSTKIMPFSSARKLSAVSFGEEGTYILGAPEFVLKDMTKAHALLVADRAKEGFRVMMLAHSPNEIEDGKPFKSVRAVALIVIEDHVRDDAQQTLSWFKQNGVAVKVISGDNPMTVAAVAKKVGIENFERYISLEGLSDREVVEVANQYTVFGRVTPEQKRILVRSIKSRGNTVAMTGDGVNDILALKESDCAIAMANGSDAARNVAHMVLMDNNFSKMPMVVTNGRRVINNIQNTTSLFLMKTIFTILLSVIIIAFQRLLNTPYPLEPRQLMILEFAVIGLPGLLLAFQPNDKRIEGRFISNVFKKSMPSGITLIIGFLVVLLFRNSYAVEQTEYVTMVVLTITFTGWTMLLLICQPFNVYRFFVCAISLTVSFLGVLLLPGFFGLTVLYDMDYIVVTAVCLGSSYVAVGIKTLLNIRLSKEKK